MYKLHHIIIKKTKLNDIISIIIMNIIQLKLTTISINTRFFYLYIFEFVNVIRTIMVSTKYSYDIFDGNETESEDLIK